jgi:SulP family sulfate permease
LITVGVGIIDYKSLKDIKHIPKSDALIMVVVTLMTVLVDLLQAVAVGMVMAALWFMKQMGDVSIEKSKGHILLEFNDEPLPDEKSLPKEIREKVYIQHFDGPIFFGFAFAFTEIVNAMPKVEKIIFRMHNVPYIDQSGMYALEDAFIELKKKKIDIILSGVQSQPKGMLEKIKIIPNVISEDKVFEKFSDAIAKISQEGFEK